MKKVLSVFLVLSVVSLIYVSCSDDSSSSGDTFAGDVEQKDIREVEDKVVITDVEDAGKDIIEIPDSTGIDEGAETAADVEPDVMDVADISDDTALADVITDTNPQPPAKILPGLGIDIIYDSDPLQIRIDNTYSTLKNIQASIPNKDVPFYLRVDSMHFDMLFVDTDGSKTLSDQDRLVRLILSKDFYGETVGHTMSGDSISKARAEFGASDNTATVNIEGTDYTFDFWFKKGINVGSDNSGKITGFTVYKAQKVVPSTEIDYENFRTLGITADLALFGSKATSISDMRNILGPEDLLTEDSANKVNYYTYLSIGASFIESSQLQDKIVTITVFPPFFGKLKGTSLSLGSSRSDVEAKFGAPKTLQQGNTTIYYYPITTKDMGLSKYDYSLGFIYNNQTDKVASILIGLPVKK